MKKNTLFKIVAGVLAAITLTCGAIAATNSKTIEIVYRNIKLMIDGAEYVPTDANGNVVEPFIYNGTTYLPVRAVANAFGKDVKWDGKNATVYLGKEGRMEPDNRLDKVQYVDYREAEEGHRMERINGSITDYEENAYSNGLIFYMDWDLNNWNVKTIEVDYPLNGQYKLLAGKIVLPKNINTVITQEDECGTSETDVIFTDEEGNVIYKAKGVTASMPFSFEIDVDGISLLTIKISTQDCDCYVALTDLALYE